MNAHEEVAALRQLLRQQPPTETIVHLRAQVTDLRRELAEAHEDLRQSSRMLARLDDENERLKKRVADLTHNAQRDADLIREALAGRSGRDD